MTVTSREGSGGQTRDRGRPGDVPSPVDARVCSSSFLDAERRDSAPPLKSRPVASWSYLSARGARPRRWPRARPRARPPLDLVARRSGVRPRGRPRSVPTRPSFPRAASSRRSFPRASGGSPDRERDGSSAARALRVPGRSPLDELVHAARPPFEAPAATPRTRTRSARSPRSWTATGRRSGACSRAARSSPTWGTRSTRSSASQRAADALKWIVWANASLDPCLFVEDARGRVGLGREGEGTDAPEARAWLAGGGGGGEGGEGPEREWLAGRAARRLRPADVAVGAYLLFVPQFFRDVSFADFPRMRAWRGVRRGPHARAFGREAAGALTRRCEEWATR